MDRVVGQIHALSSSNKDLETLKEKLSVMQDVIITHIGSIDQVLEMVPPETFSLGHLVLLSFKSIVSFEPRLFVDQVLYFLRHCSASQIRLVPEKFQIVCQKFVELCIENDLSMLAIKPLRQCMWKIGPRNMFTPLHPMLLLCCIVSKCYKAALSTLDSDCFTIDKKATGTTTRDLLLYYYYGGLVYAALKRYDRAQEFFIRVLSFPAQAPSAIMVAAYKKWVLTSLILHGNVGSVGQYASSTFARQMKQICPVYNELISSYNTNSVLDLQTCFTINQEAFISDGNGGLVKQVIKTLEKRNISGLTKTYLTLSLQNISEKTQTEILKLEKNFVSMIDEGEIFAQIDQSSGMVQFKEDPNQYNSQETMSRLDRQIGYVIDLNKFVSTLDESITTSQEYVQKMLQSKRGKWGPPSGMEDHRFEGILPGDFKG